MTLLPERSWTGLWCGSIRDTLGHNYLRRLILYRWTYSWIANNSNQPAHLSNSILLFEPIPSRPSYWHPKRCCNSTSCVSFRAPLCWGDVCQPLRQGWPGYSALASKWWTTIVARRWPPRWTPRSSAWGASRWTSGQYRLCSSRRRAGTCSNCLWPTRLRRRSSVMETGALLSRSCRSAPSVVEWLGGIKASLCDLTSKEHVDLSATFVKEFLFHFNCTCVSVLLTCVCMDLCGLVEIVCCYTEQWTWIWDISTVLIDAFLAS